jgi:hypothetical protein
MGKSLFEIDAITSAERILLETAQKSAEIWIEIYSEALSPYEAIWRQTEPKLKKFRLRFETEWRSVYDSLLTEMSNIAKLPWK